MVTRKLAKALLGEQLGDEAGVLVNARSAPVSRGQTGALLASMLESKEPEERQASCFEIVGIGRKGDAENAARISSPPSEFRSP